MNPIEELDIDSDDIIEPKWLRRLRLVTTAFLFLYAYYQNSIFSLLFYLGISVDLLLAARKFLQKKSKGLATAMVIIWVLGSLAYFFILGIDFMNYQPL